MELAAAPVVESDRAAVLEPSPVVVDGIGHASTGQAPRRRASALARFGVAFLIGLIAAMALGVGALYAYDQQYVGRVLPGVNVGGVDLSGLTEAEASATLAERVRLTR